MVVLGVQGSTAPSAVLETPAVRNSRIHARTAIRKVEES